MSKEKISKEIIQQHLKDYLKLNKKIENEIGNFVIKGQVGQGGTSVIREVAKVGDKQKCVIKFLLENELYGTRAYKRFKQAFNAISKLKSDAILPQIYLSSLKISEEIFIPYVLMPKAKGGTLKEIKEENEITFEIFESIFNRMMYLLKEIHNKKIIHRDLKPENIFFLKENHIESMVLGDFDIAKFDEKLYEKLLETKDNERLANYLFSAPEQKEKEKKFDDITYSADLYAFGQILHWLVMGETLQGQKKIKFSRYDKRFGKYEPIVEKLLQDDSDDRFQSVEEIESALSVNSYDKKNEKRKKIIDIIIDIKINIFSQIKNLFSTNKSVNIEGNGNHVAISNSNNNFLIFILILLGISSVWYYNGYVQNSPNEDKPVESNESKEINISGYIYIGNEKVSGVYVKLSQKNFYRAKIPSNENGFFSLFYKNNDKELITIYAETEKDGIKYIDTKKVKYNNKDVSLELKEDR